MLSDHTSETRVSWPTELVLMVNLLESLINLYVSGLEPNGILKYAFLASLVEASVIDWTPKVFESCKGASQYIFGLLVQSVSHQSLALTKMVP